MEQLVYEEDEFLAIVLEIQPATVGVSLFLSDREVEYYRARFPDCCSRHTSQEDIPIKSFATAVAVWTEKWTLANIMTQDETRPRFGTSIQT